MVFRKRGVQVLILAAAVLLSIVLLNSPQVTVAQSGDGRLNCDEAAPVVLYCGDLGLDVYDPEGDLLLRVPYDDLDVARPATYTQVGGTPDGSIGVYVLSTWEIQVNVENGDELWTARWWNCPGGPAEIEVFSMLNGERLSWEKDSCNLPDEVEMCEYWVWPPQTEETDSAPCSEVCNLVDYDFIDDDGQRQRPRDFFVLCEDLDNWLEIGD
ncbi:MAG: hypothetical protein Kow0077_22940 [Anaerolineae bacterium]